jgi:hypothetical protein
MPSVAPSTRSGSGEMTWPRGSCHTGGDPCRPIGRTSAVMNIGRCAAGAASRGSLMARAGRLRLWFSIRVCRRFLTYVKGALVPIGHCPPNSGRGRVQAMRSLYCRAPPCLVVIDKGSYETLTYFLNRSHGGAMAEHGGRLYERELEPPYWRAAKAEAPGSGGRRATASG